MKINRRLLTFVGILLFCTSNFAGEKEYSSIPLNNDNIIIDGILDENIWDLAGFRYDFI